MQDLITALARLLVSEPDAVRVTASELGRDTLLELTVAPEDVGRIIGRQGRTIRSLRTVLAAAGRDSDRGCQLEVLDRDES